MGYQIDQRGQSESHLEYAVVDVLGRSDLGKGYLLAEEARVKSFHIGPWLVIEYQRGEQCYDGTYRVRK